MWILYKFIKKFSKTISLLNNFLLNVPPTEILATPLQEIFSLQSRLHACAEGQWNVSAYSCYSYCTSVQYMYSMHRQTLKMLSGGHVGTLQKVSKIWSIEQSLYYILIDWTQSGANTNVVASDGPPMSSSSTLSESGRKGVRPPVLFIDAQPELHPGS